jgi:hypothetical protein
MNAILIVLLKKGITHLESHYRTIYVLFLDFDTFYEMIDRIQRREKELLRKRIQRNSICLLLGIY